MKKLTVDHVQLYDINAMLAESVNYYQQQIKNAQNLVDLSKMLLVHNCINGIFVKVNKLCELAKNQMPHVHRQSIVLTSMEAIAFCTSIVPTNNLSYREKVKQVVIDYCFEVLKEANLIPNSPAYSSSEKLAPNKALPYINKSTTMNDFFNE